MAKKNWTFNAPDSFEPLLTGLVETEYGDYQTYGEAKKNFLRCIQNNIKNLQHYKKQVLESKKSDWQNKDGDK